MEIEDSVEDIQVFKESNGVGTVKVIGKSNQLKSQNFKIEEGGNEFNAFRKRLTRWLNFNFNLNCLYWRREDRFLILSLAIYSCALIAYLLLSN